MTAPERFADSQIPLAPRAPSIHGPMLSSAFRRVTCNCRHDVGGPADGTGCRLHRRWAKQRIDVLLNGRPVEQSVLP
jgi:hypothetical protein